MWKTNEVLSVLDIGGSKICVLVGRKTSRGVDIIGMGLTESEGLRKGQITNIDLVTKAIRVAIEEAELMASCEINSVYLVASSKHIHTQSGHGLVNISGSEVSEVDLKSVKAAAHIPGPKPGQTLLHSITEHFIVDDGSPLKDPIGVFGERLEAYVNLFLSKTEALSNTRKACIRAELNIEGTLLGIYATGETILTAQERKEGVLLVELGDSTTDIGIWLNNSMIYANSIALGGANVTNDVSIGLRTSTSTAKHLKEYYGAAMASMVNVNDVVLVPRTQGHQAHRKSRALLASIIEPRMDEIFRFVRNDIEMNGFRDQIKSAVLTGGGATLFGSELVAERMLRIPTHQGALIGELGGFVDAVRHPKYACAVGVMQQIALHGTEITYQEPNRRFTKQTRRSFWDRIRRLF